jgi:hypothetical protein
VRKTFVEGKWRELREDGSAGSPCEPPTEVERQQAKYQEQADRTQQEVWWRGERFTPRPGVAVDAPSAAQLRFRDHPVPKPPPPGSKIYKVLTQRDEWFMGKFSPEKLEDAINSYAADGWRVVSMAAADVATWLGAFGGTGRQELVVLLEKTADDSAKPTA